MTLFPVLTSENRCDFCIDTSTSWPRWAYQRLPQSQGQRMDSTTNSKAKKWIQYKEGKRITRTSMVWKREYSLSSKLPVGVNTVSILSELPRASVTYASTVNTDCTSIRVTMRNCWQKMAYRCLALIYRNIRSAFQIIGRTRLYYRSASMLTPPVTSWLDLVTNSRSALMQGDSL